MPAPSRRSPRAALLQVACAALLAGAAAAQLRWATLPTTARPSLRSMHMACDAGPLGVVLFGGELSYAQARCIDDTWRWANGAWTQVPTATAPSPRSGGGMCYDPVRGRVVCFGGWSGRSYLNDTWEFDGSTWTEVTPSGPSPDGRDWPQMAFDPIGRTVVLFGGHDWTRPDFGDTWSWDGSAWTRLTPATSPAPRFGGVMVHCESFGFAVLHGGTGLDDTWLWLGGDWLRIVPANPPPPRWHAAAAWDPLRERMVLIGGNPHATSNVSGDVWEFDVSGWTPRAPGGQGPRTYHSAAFFDPVRGEVVVHGGSTSASPHRSGLVDTTWALGPVTPAVTATFGAGCGAAPALDAVGLAWAGGSWRVRCSGAPPHAPVLFVVGFSDVRTSSGSALPQPLGGLGMPGCTLLVDPLAAAAATTAAAGDASLVLAVPSDPLLVGADIYAQLAMPRGAANPAGVVLSNATRHRIGGK